MSRILGDCQLWNLNDINVAIADEYGIYFSANLHDYKTPEALIATVERRDNYKPKILSSFNKSYMAEDFLKFFAQENDPSVLNIAYIITDHMFDWKYSRFLTWLKKSQSKVANLINLKQIYTKLIVYLYTKPLVFRNTTHLMTIHQDASYYFEQIYFIESPIDVFYESKRTYSICDELKNNKYECSCCPVGLHNNQNLMPNQSRLPNFIPSFMDKTDLNKLGTFTRNDRRVKIYLLEFFLRRITNMASKRVSY
uniref:Uncharacterized protein n=1 Tax=Acrobeloides nanus TaxID=290746 RepID=A0A914E1T9_9BILA